MLNYLRKLLSPEIRVARRLLRYHSTTATEAYESAEKILNMASYHRHVEIRHMRAGCLIEGMAKPHPDALACAKVATEILREFDLVDYGAAALRHAATECREESLKKALMDQMETLPGLLRARVVGELYRIENGQTIYRNSREIQEYAILASGLKEALEPAYQQYSEHLTSIGYRVSGRYADGPGGNGRFQLALMASHA